MSRQISARCMLAIACVLVSSVLLGHPRSASAQEVQITFGLEGSGGSYGKVALTSDHGGTSALVAVYGLAPASQIIATVNAGTCAQPSASAASIASIVTDAKGAAVYTAPVLFHGTDPVALSAIADGQHVMMVSTGSVTACGVILPLSTALPVGAPGTPPVPSGTAGLGGVSPAAPRTGNLGHAATSATLVVLLAVLTAVVPLLARHATARR